MSSTDTSKDTIAAVTPKAPAAKPAAKSAKGTAKKVAPAKKATVKAKPAPAAVSEKPAAKTAKPVKSADTAASTAKAKQKLVRDSFTMPRGDFGLINTLKERALGFRRPTKKSELLRAGLHALALLPDAKLKVVLDGLVPLKTGRPKKDE